MVPDFFKFSIPTKVIYGEGISNRLSEELEYLGPKKVLLVTDKVMGTTGLVDRIRAGLASGPVQIVCVYDDVPPNSELKCVTDAAELGKSHNVDCIMALGGGSVMDTAKVANILISKGGKVQDHMGAQLITDKLLPSIFIPTTSGTGAEVTQFAIIMDAKNHVKLPFSEDAIIPDIAILDPELTKTMPGKLTAATGMDALTHAIEAYVSNQANPGSDALALAAIELISANILQACAVPDDIQARGAMLTASFMAGAAFNSAGVGIVHAVSHALGGVYHIPHGLANSIILPLGIEFNLESAAPRYAKIAEAMGAINVQPVGEIQKGVSKLNLPVIDRALDNFGFVDEWLMNFKAESLPAKIRELNRKLKHLTGFATNLREAGISDGMKKISDLVQLAMDDGSTLYNPCPVTKEGVRDILQKAFDQDLPAWKMTDADFKAARLKTVKRRPKNVYKDSAALYEVLIPFFELLRDDQKVGPGLKEAELSVRFNYSEPDASIVIDGKNADVMFLSGDEAKKAEVDIEMSMKADFAHYFWHGKANVVQALTRREVVAKGNLPRALRLLPILEPAYVIYPDFLRKKGLASIIVD